MMSEFVYLQWLQALESIYAGVKLCIVYEVLHIICRVFICGSLIHKKIIRGIIEYLYWCYVGIKMYIVIYTYNSGTLRIFIVLLAIGGALIFHYGIGRWTSKYSIRILDIIFNKFIANVLSKVLNIVFNIVLKKPIKTVIITMSKISRVKRRNDNVKKD